MFSIGYLHNVVYREHNSTHKFAYAKKKGHLIKGLKAFISYFTAGDDL